MNQFLSFLPFLPFSPLLCPNRHDLLSFHQAHTCSYLCTWGSQVCSVPAHSHSRQLISPRSPFRGPSPEHPTCSHDSYLTKPRFCMFPRCPSSSVRKSTWGFLHVRRARLLNQTPAIFLRVFTSLQNLVDRFSNTCISLCWKYKPWEIGRWLNGKVFA